MRLRVSSSMLRRQPDVDLAHVRRIHHRLRLALSDLLAEVEHDQPADDGDKRMHDVLDPYDRSTGRMNLPDGADQFLAFALGQPAGDFVEQEEMRAGGERARHFQPLALKECERAGGPVRTADEVRAFENVRAWLRSVALRQTAAVHGGDEEILEYGEIFERLRDLVRAPDAGDTAPLRLV